MSDYSKYITIGGTIRKIVHRGEGERRTSEFFSYEEEEIKGLDKVPFAFDLKGNEVSIEDAKKFYNYSLTIESLLKPLKNHERLCTNFWADLFYLPKKKNTATKCLSIIYNLFHLYFLNFLDQPLTCTCPSCRGEVLFDYRAKKEASWNFFTHKSVYYQYGEENLEKLETKDSHFQYKKEILLPLLNNKRFTREELTELIKTLKYSIGDIEREFPKSDVIDLINSLSKVTSEFCNFTDETAKHLRAKWKVTDAIKRDDKIYLIRKCSRCNRIGRQFFPVKSLKASHDYILPSGHRVDIAIFDEENNLKSVIEIMDEVPVSKGKEEKLEGIYWAEFSAETILGSNEWLVKRGNLKSYLCKDCKKQDEDMFPETTKTIIKPIPSGKGRVRFESENYYFYLDFLLKEEFRYPKEMVELAVKELNKFFEFKVKEILSFNKDGSADTIYKYDYSEKLPPDKDIMWVLSFIINDGHWINILDHYIPVPNNPEYVHPKKFHKANAEKYIRSHWESSHAVDGDGILCRFLGILNRFFYLKNEEKIYSLKYWDCKFFRKVSNKYRKKQRKNYRYSVPHEDAFGSKIEEILGKAMEKENIEFIKQYKLYADGKQLTIPDFYIEKSRIVIYCDGFEYHYNKESVIKDRFQDRELQYIGYRVLRFTGSEIIGNVDKCVYDIQRFMKRFP